MEQGDLFDDICRNNHGGNQESEAANPTKKSKERVRRQVYEHIERIGGATCDEIEIALGLSHQTASARCSELKALGLVRPNGKRPTRSGRKAAILEVIGGEESPCEALRRH